MSEARHQRFEIDIEEIERQLRQSANLAPAPRPDPLAELARIVDQDDTFRNMLGDRKAAEPRSNVHVLNRPAASPSADPLAPVLDDADRAVLYGVPGQGQVGDNEAFDPVAETYGSAGEALVERDFQPLQRRKSRGRLAVVMAAVLLTAGAVAGGLYWRQSGSLLSGGTPPVITADKTPLKVAPADPGGMEVPNQDRQIYERGPRDGQSRVVDGREQPIDVREAVRNLPPPQSGPAVSARTPVPSATEPASGTSNVVANALGEPRRVRTVAVRPDGSVYTPGATTMSDAPPSLLPGDVPPPPVSVATVPVQGRGGQAPVPVPTATAALPATTAGTSPVADPVPDAQPATPPITSNVLPPPRPRTESAAPADGDTPVRTAAASATPAASAAGRFSVQVAVRPTEDEVRTAYIQLLNKYPAELEGRPARVVSGEVGGKTVHRARVGPMSKDDATALCNKLKTAGGSCFVAND